MSKRVECPGGVPAWPTAAARLPSPQMRMIDGQLAFPDEVPPADWRELRISLGGHMITIRRDGDAVEIVTWGNADEALHQAWESVARAFTPAG